MNRLDDLPFGLVAEAALTLQKPPKPAPVKTIWGKTPPPPTPEAVLYNVMTWPAPSEAADLRILPRAMRQGMGTGLYENLVGYPFAPPGILGGGSLGGAIAAAEIRRRGMTNTTYGPMRPRVLNAAAFQDAWDDYPWPGEEWIWVKSLMERCGATLKELVQKGPPLSKLDARNWTTVALTSEFDRLADRYEAIAAKEARQDARRRIRFAAGLAVVTSIFTMGAGALGVSAGSVEGAVGKIGEKQAKAAAKGLREMAKQFAENEPLFALEIQRVADLFGPEVFDQAPSASRPEAGEKETAPDGIQSAWARFLAWVESLLGR